MGSIVWQYRNIYQSSVAVDGHHMEQHVYSLKENLSLPCSNKAERSTVGCVVCEMVTH